MTPLMAAPRKAPFDSFQSALVTGASSGIGAALAQALLDRGLTVYGTSRQPARSSPRKDLRWLPLEAASPSGLNRFLQDQDEMLEEIDILVNNCGGGCFGDLTGLERETLSSQLQLLLITPMELTRVVLPGMRKRARGAVVNISSLAAEFPLPYQAPYSAAKGGLSQFTQSLMLTEENREIVFLDVQPGDIATAFNRQMDPGKRLPPGEARVWRKVEEELAAGPPPARVARDVMRALERGGSRRLRSGGFFQCRVAPLGLRLLPRSLFLRLIRHFYGIGHE